MYHCSLTMSPSSDDPFACFDDDDDSDVDDDEQHDGDIKAAPLIRNPDCGVLAFHRGTERSLLIFVRNQLLSAATVTPELVMKAVDDFCIQRHWMMHVGPEKSSQLQAFLQECVDYQKSLATPKSKPFVLLELGTYCGYSSILWASTLKNMELVDDFHVYTVEPNPECIDVARGLIELAGLTSHISVLHLDILGKNQQLVDLLKLNGVPGDAIAVDFVFLDHDKDAYLDDLQDLEKAGIVRQGVHVAADNVLFARIDSYREYVQSLAEKGIVQTHLVKGALEYSEIEQQRNASSTDKNDSDDMDFEDGIGKYFRAS